MAWQDQYEQAAQQEQEEYETMPNATLLNQIRLGQYGRYNMIWYTLARRVTLNEAGWLLYSILQQNDLDYLIRCNCAEALLKLLGRTDVLKILNEAVKLSGNTPAERQPYLKALHQKLIERIGNQ